ncbi:hypothetical protein LXA43DRAFT_1069694 [Ganoderma leucocontextum]|nr:hypothetical protein LXA43DRAFT_1069694 [Ganoderma leucocontextum]
MPPPTIIPVHPDNIYAKWRWRITHKQRHPAPLLFTDCYDVTICPEHPLAVGRTVKIHALSKEAYHVPLYPPPLPTRYDTYDPQIEGRIIRIRSIEGDTVEFVLENRIEGAAVNLAYIAVQCIPNVTVQLDEVEMAYWRQTRYQPTPRYIPLEGAVIVHTVVEAAETPARGAAGPETRDPEPEERNVGTQVTADPDRPETETTRAGSLDLGEDGNDELDWPNEAALEKSTVIREADYNMETVEAKEVDVAITERSIGCAIGKNQA